MDHRHELTQAAPVDEFSERIQQIPEGYSEGFYDGRRYGVTKEVLLGGRTVKLYAQELAAGDIVSFNLFCLRDGTTRLKPCEMPSEKVRHFVLNYSTQF